MHENFLKNVIKLYKMVISLHVARLVLRQYSRSAWPVA